MELEEMKSMWQKYDALLQQNKLLNEQLIIGMLKSKSENAIKRMLHYEYLNTGVCFVLMVIYMVMYRTLNAGTGIAVCYIISFTLMIITLVVFYKKYHLLSSLDFGSNSVSDTAEKLEQFRLLIAKERSWSLWLSPLVIFTTVVVIAYWVRHSNAFDYMSLYLPLILIGSVVTIIAVAFIYKSVYFKSIKDIKHNLSEIENFKQ
jgi:hypothetical protein